MFLFLDPPYLTAERLYGRGGQLHLFDHERLARILQGTPHRFLMTYDDCPDTRDLYDWAYVKPWPLQYGMSNCSEGSRSIVGLLVDLPREGLGLSYS